MPRSPAVLLLAACLFACTTVREPAGLSEIEPVSGHPSDLELDRSRWVGIGSYDACGLSWALDLFQEGDQVSGRFLWETVRYDVNGTISQDGTLRKTRVGKNPEFSGVPSPRFVFVSLDFGTDRAVGYYAADIQGSNDCATAVELHRYAAE